MATLTLPEVFNMKNKLQELETKIESGELSLFERCEVEDEILAIKESLGEFDRQKNSDGDECLHCSS